MPRALEEKLMREARKKGVKDKGAYVYGTLRKEGWTPSTQKPKAGRKRRKPSK